MSKINKAAVLNPFSGLTADVEITGNLSVGGTINATLEGTAASADKLHVARKIQGVDFDGTQDISLPTFSTQIDGLVPKPEGSTTTKYLREDGAWVVPPDTTYTLLTKGSAEDGTATTANTISAQVLKEAIQYHAPTVTDITGNAGTATKLQTPRTINGVLFDGTQNISLPEAVAYSLPTASDSVLGGIKVGSGLAISNSVLSVGTLNQSTTGNAATATKLQTARTIGGVAFDGTTNISLPGVNTAGNQNTSGNAATATKLATAVNINGVPFDGSQDINIDVGNGEGGSGVVYSAMTSTEAQQGTSTSEKVITPAVLKSAIQYHAPEQTDITGNAATATKLETPRIINGVNFDGTANVITTTWGTARTLTIGNTGKSVNGSANVAWTVHEILPPGSNGQVLKHNGTSWVAGTDSNTIYSAMLATEANIGTATLGRTITAAVLKGAIQTHAPVSACRAWLSVNAVTSTILQSFNIASFVKTATGHFEITFITPMPHQDYVAFTNSITVKGGAVTSNTVGSTFNATQTNTVSCCYIWCWSTTTGALINPEVLNVGVFC